MSPGREEQRPSHTTGLTRSSSWSSSTISWCWNSSLITHPKYCWLSSPFVLVVVVTLSSLQVT